MKRTVIELESKDNEKISEMIQQILISKGFKQTTFKEEEVWKKGNDMIQPAKHFRYYFKGDKVILEGFVTNFGRESGLNGFIGAIPKRGVKKLLREVEEKVNEFNRQYQ